MYSLTKMGSNLDLEHRLEFADLCSIFLTAEWKQIVSIGVVHPSTTEQPLKAQTYQLKEDPSFKLSPDQRVSDH